MDERIRRTVRVQGRDVADGGDIDLDVEDIRLADGSRLTEALAQKLADDVLRRVGPGRPSLSRPGQRSPQLRLSVPEQLRDDLQARAAAEQRSVSDLAREALSRFLAS